jgi:hypothetical protein
MRCSCAPLVAAVAAAVALVALATGCTPAACGRTSECPTGQVCTAPGVCAIPADAAGDGGPSDAGSSALGDVAARVDAIPEIPDADRRSQIDDGAP